MVDYFFLIALTFFFIIISLNINDLIGFYRTSLFCFNIYLF